MASMRDFLMAGHLGKVQLGLRPEQVIGFLGEPEDRSVQRRPVYLLQYGAMEFAFKPVPASKDSRLVSIAMHFQGPKLDIPSSLRPSDWEPTCETTEREFRTFAESAGIDVHSTVQGEMKHLVLSSGASAAFSDERLHSIHFKRSEKKTNRRQMTVSLPEETVELLRERARKERVSIHDLIERMIKASA